MVRKRKEVRKIKKLTDGTEDSFISFEEGSEYTVEANQDQVDSVQIQKEFEKTQFQKWRKTEFKDQLLDFFNKDILASEDFIRKQKEQDKKIK